MLGVLGSEARYRSLLPRAYQTPSQILEKNKGLRQSEPGKIHRTGIFLSQSKNLRMMISWSLFLWDSWNGAWSEPRAKSTICVCYIAFGSLWCLFSLGKGVRKATILLVSSSFSWLCIDMSSSWPDVPFWIWSYLICCQHTGNTILF